MGKPAGKLDMTALLARARKSAAAGKLTAEQQSTLSRIEQVAKKAPKMSGGIAALESA